MDHHIIPMTAAHLPAVAALEKVCFPADPWSEELFRWALAGPRTCVLLAQGEDGGILGYAVVSTVLDEGNLDNIAVAPEARRQGVADALLSALTGFGRKRLSRLMLEVRASNSPAIALYEKMGFQTVGRRKNYYRELHEDALLMTVEFSAPGETEEKS